LAIIVGAMYITEPEPTTLPKHTSPSTHPQRVKQIDIAGSCALVLGLSALLCAVNIGQVTFRSSRIQPYADIPYRSGNEAPWMSLPVIGSAIAAAIVLVFFLFIELKAFLPIVPHRLLTGKLALSNICTNFFSGMSAYAVRHVCVFCILACMS
jgi:hypothetical protein